MKTCTKCGETKVLGEFYPNPDSSDGLHSQCKQCHALHGQEYRKNHKEEMSEYQRKYYLRNRSKILTTQKERNRACKKEKAAYDKAYRAAHLEKRTKQGREYHAANPEKAREAWRIRRARKASAIGNFSAKEFQALCERTGNKCLCCGSLGPLQADHVIPLSRGGRNDLSNIQPLCGPCNNQKFTKTTDYR